MNTKWKTILLVMLIIISICGVFITLFIFDSRENLNNLVDTDIKSIRAIVQTIEEEYSRNYRSRIQSFINYKEFPKREKIIQAFSRRDREELLRLTTPYLNILQKENPYFSTLAWVTPDNHNFLRVHRPLFFGDNIGKIRSDIVDSNKEQRPHAGYMVAGSGLQYRLVQPVTYEGKHLGIVQFGLKDSLLLETLQKKLNLPVGLVIPNKKFSLITSSQLPSLAGSTHTIQATDIDLFQQDLEGINWSLDQQEVVLNGKTHIIANALNLLDYKQQVEGFIFVALDISEQLAKLWSRILLILLLGSALLVCSFLILYFSYGSLIQKIFILNKSLEKNISGLENRVYERTTKLNESEKRLQNILDHAPLGIMIAQARTMRLQYCNPAICKMLGYDKEELENMGIESLHRPADLDHVIDEFKKQVQGGKLLAPDIPFLCKDGTMIKADVITTSVELDGQLCAAGFVVDQTERKNLETQLRRAQKMEVIGMMAGGVAHDLNNILSGIINYPELLLLQLPESSDLRKPIEAIRESGKRAATVVSDLLTVARGAASTREPHDINVLIQEYLDSPECKKLKSLHPDVLCTKQLDAEHSIISCSPVHIKKTVMNLMTNAAEAVAGTGDVIISTCNRQIVKNGSNKHNIKPGEYVVLTVHDNGPGIDDKDLEHIFEPFYTRKVMGQSGTGLGLTVIWNTMEDHDGKIVVESSAEGTIFQLFFPISEEDEIAPIENHKTKPFSGNNEHILVVDDEPLLRDIACQVLRSFGYAVNAVRSGELAIQFVKENPVDLILIDMLMEPGMNGRQTYEEIIKLYPRQKAIVVSGFSESDDVRETLRLGASDFIKKPYSIEQLGRVVKKALTD